jgi:hypothetical protein
MTTHIHVIIYNMFEYVISSRIGLVVWNKIDLVELRFNCI